MRRWCAVPSTPTWPFNYEIGWHRKSCDERLSGWLQSPAGDPVCRYPPARGHQWILSVHFLSPMGAAGERPEFDIKPALMAALLIFRRGDFLRLFPQGDASARMRGFEIRVIPLLGELPRAIESHLPACRLYRWQLYPNMRSSPTTKKLDPIVVTALRVEFPWEGHALVTRGIACNCPMPEAWTTRVDRHVKKRL